VLQKYLSLYGEDHPRTHGSKGFLAELYRKQGRYDDAARLYEEVLAKYEEKHVSDAASLVALSELAQTHLEAKQLDKALPLIGRFIREHQEQLNAESPLLAEELACIGLLLVKNAQYLEAGKRLRQSLAIREKKEPGVWTTFNTQSMLGAALLGEKNYAEAEPLLRQGYEGMKERENKIPAHKKFRLTEALERLVQFYDAWDKPDEAAKWRKELEKTKKKP
jgi:eukaryotic-like serine/threonine-protein kinase